MKMKLEKKHRRILLFAVPILVGLYLIFKKPTPKTPTTPTNPTPTPPTSTFNKYIVTTISSSLNVRSQPSTNSSSVSSLPKGSEIFAKQSAIDGWSEYSKDGSKVDGYVSTQYLTKK